MAAHPVKLPLWLRRLGWLVLIWVASVAALGAAAWLLRLLMAGAGFHR
ncbi:hypothetical protein LMG31506_03541 [Cupriavidus yeoncheonensis]|uniref:DUF2474 domain-containing protein n=1 Tax=Cupriavidus yeoncheonensis TaxID=1462994 RepID=A0A916IUC5_9BURK|nr:DUF2474 family protein [Cupriavidus yeoncheonensis]CAG2147074.1 hypothetical protein LMG31506_03541 [Cupriavidus yeoncheonensis]